MNVMQHKGSIEVIAIGLKPGEMLLESIEEAVLKNDIQNGVVVSGIGTLKTCQLHHITHTNFPSTNEYYTIEQPLELVSVSGIIANGEPHLHVVVSYKDEKVYSGHLEHDSEVLYLAEIVILKFNELQMARNIDEKWNIRLLGLKEKS